MLADFVGCGLGVLSESAAPLLLLDDLLDFDLPCFFLAAFVFEGGEGVLVGLAVDVLSGSPSSSSAADFFGLGVAEASALDFFAAGVFFGAAVAAFFLLGEPAGLGEGDLWCSRDASLADSSSPT